MSSGCISATRQNSEFSKVVEYRVDTRIENGIGQSIPDVQIDAPMISAKRYYVLGLNREHGPLTAWWWKSVSTKRFR